MPVHVDLLLVGLVCVPAPVLLHVHVHVVYQSMTLRTLAGLAVLVVY